MLLNKDIRSLRIQFTVLKKEGIILEDEGIYGMKLTHKHNILFLHRKLVEVFYCKIEQLLILDLFVKQFHELKNNFQHI